jgi:hypothetical protein
MEYMLLYEHVTCYRQIFGHSSFKITKLDAVLFV